MTDGEDYASVWEHREPPPNRCSVCGCVVVNARKELRPTGVDGKLQEWPYCASCASDFLFEEIEMKIRTPHLCDLALTYGVDKLHSHSYVPWYCGLFATLEIEVKNVLEIGIGYADLMRGYTPNYVHGGSLHMWAAYWPQAQVYGLDIRADTMVNDERIHSFCVNAADPDALADFMAAVGVKWDVVIDDGSHETKDQIISARALLPHVNLGGVYIVEDVREPELVANYLRGEAVKFGRMDDNLVICRKR